MNKKTAAAVRRYNLPQSGRILADFMAAIVGNRLTYRLACRAVTVCERWRARAWQRIINQGGEP